MIIATVEVHGGNGPDSDGARSRFSFPRALHSRGERVRGGDLLRAAATWGSVVVVKVLEALGGLFQRFLTRVDGHKAGPNR